MTENYKQLVSKLKSFQQKYYLFLLIKGVLLFFILLICYYSVISLFEYFQYTGTVFRTVLFFFTLLLIVVSGIWFILIPIFKLFGLVKPISFKTASLIISMHFPEIQDRLINILELAEEHHLSNALVLASIDKKISQLKVIDFSEAIDKQTFKVPGILFFISILIVFILNLALPHIYSEVSYRIINFSQGFAKPAPFTFTLLTDNLNVKKGESLKIKVLCEGKEIPDILYLNIEGSNFLMTKDGEQFNYTIEQVHNDLNIFFTDLIYTSSQYEIKTLANPGILSYSIQISPPAYTGYKEEILQNSGDLKVPYGSKLQWKFNTIDTDSLLLKFDEADLPASFDANNFVFDYVSLKNQSYTISLINQFFEARDLLQFSIEVIPDLFPEIEVVQLRDSLEFSCFYFKGSISDDYGFNDLVFNVSFANSDTIFQVPILKNLNEQDFYFTYNFKEIKDLAADFTYYFTVSDNDYFHHFKETTSESFQFKFPSNKELISSDNQMFTDIESLVNKSVDLSNDLKKSLDELKFKSISETTSDWEKQQLMNEILNKKNQLEQMLDQVKKNNAEMNQMMNSFSEEKEELINKQKEIEGLLEEVMNDELKALFDEFNKLAKEFDQEKLNDLMNDAEMPLDDLSKQLERNLQMLKRLKIEQKLEQIIQMLTEISDKEKSNGWQLNQSKDTETVAENEKENKDLVNSLFQEMAKIMELNQTLEKPMNLFSVDKEFNTILDQYSVIDELLTKSRNKKAGDEISENSSQIANLAFLIQQMLENNKQKQNAENLQNLKQILDNLVFLSLSQEDLLVREYNLDLNDPLLNTLRQNQDQLIEQTKIAKDSLYALANRTPAISSKVNSELLKLESVLVKSVDELEEGNIGSAQRYQQNAVTSFNEMALFLNEALDNLEKQMANSMPGDQECDKPGQNGKQGMNLLKQAQQSLKDQMQQMIEQMKSGEGKNMSQQIGKTLAQQEMLQQMIREMLTDSEVGSSAKEQLKQIETLIEQNRLDLMNKNLSSTMISRQNLILNKLLKAEKAEMERDVDDERESKSADEKFYSNPAEFFEYKQTDKNRIENIQYNNYKLRNYYDQKYKKYINSLKD